MRHAPVVYLETSVFGFYADELPHNRIHSDAVRKRFDQIEAGILDGVTSRVTIEELNDAPPELKPGLMDLLRYCGYVTSMTRKPADWRSDTLPRASFRSSS
jgi:hypothetical protein